MPAPGLGVTSRVVLCSWTALGEWWVSDAASRDHEGAQYERTIGTLMATTPPYLNVVFPSNRAGAQSCTHPGLLLPADAAQRTACGLVPYCLLMEPAHAARLAPNAVNLTSAPTGLTHVSEAQALEHLVKEQLIHEVFRAIYNHGALNDFTTRVPPCQEWRFPVLPPGSSAPGGFSLSQPMSFEAYSQMVPLPAMGSGVTTA
jgi:hypothetical protein